MTDKYINKTIVYIDSHNKGPDETHDDFTAVINIDKEVDSVCVLRATIKKAYYLVQSGQNTFTLQEGVSTATITLPEGNYSASSFRTILAGLLNTASPNGYTYSISFPNPLTQPSTGKYTYSVTNNSGVQPAFIVGEYLYEQLGLERNSTNNFVSDSLVSTNIVNFQLKDTLRIHSNIVTDQPTNILQEVTASTTADFSSIKYDCLDIEAHSKPFNIKLNNFRFTILDEDSKKVNLGLNVLITLLFYKKNTSADIANEANTNYIKYSLLNNRKK